MIRRIIVLLTLLIGLVAAAMAQNSIDRMIDNHLSRGQSKFTSAVERDPATRKVKKVVKVLHLHDNDIRPFINAFRDEAKTENFSETYDDEGCTLMLTTQNSRQNRIYMMQCMNPYIPGRRDTGYGYAKITLIINYK